MSEQMGANVNMGKVINEVSLLELFRSNNLVIPEIQREYVWGDKKIGKRVLDGFLRDFLKSVQRFANAREVLVQKSDKLKEQVRQFLVESGYGNVKDERLAAFSDGVTCDENSNEGIMLNSKVGFVYAYIPGFAKDGVERILPAYLIDGQQRVTTFFLIWLHLASKANEKASFKDSIRYGSPSLAFDFKVRPLTHEFLNQLVKEVIESDTFDFSNITDATWFLSDYRHDVSVMSMVNALESWDSVWSKSHLDAGVAYEYLTRHVTFWLFVMNETVQGERLYITMNGRGKNLSEDEIIRAKVFRDAVMGSPQHTATEVGSLFEKMTDFFWTHRVTGELTADKGMKKFFRWVHLLERFEAERNVQGMPEFSAALRNDGKDGKWFELDEKMFGLDEETGATRITFELIKSTFDSLKILYRSDSPTQPYLRPSVLEADDRSDAFQQDCFVLLPLLHWRNKVQHKMESRVIDLALAQLARYLRKMATKEDVSRAPAEAVPNALKLADAFIQFNSGDFLGFLGADSTANAKLSVMVFPDEEPAKANRLLSVRMNDNEHDGNGKLFKKYEALLAEMEYFKSSEFSSKCDYRIASFLGLNKDWKSVEWNAALYEEYQTAFTRFKKFWTDRNPLRRVSFLVAPEMDGYYETNMKLFPYGLVSMMGDTDTIKKIVAFENAVNQYEADAAFDAYEREFLRNHWKTRDDEKDPRVLCALALIVHRLAGGQFNADWTKVQFEHKYYENKKFIENPEVRPVGKSGLYFWFLDAKDQRWRYVRATESYLLRCHKITADEANELVKKFLSKTDGRQ